MRKAKLKHLLVDEQVVKRGDFTLTSGKKSDYYVDMKKGITNPIILAEIANIIVPMITNEEKIGCVELGAVPIAVVVSIKKMIPYVIIRKGERTHGTGKRIEGEVRKGERFLFIEDVVTTGQTIADAIEILRNEGAIVERAITVVDRDEGGREKLKEKNIELLSIFTAKELLI
ncbi:MAG: orotate phosphoribosyltransferase [Candidatus Thermoplasmatota archaeon]